MDGLSKIENIIQRFEAGDKEVQYEYIQSAQDLSVDAMDGDTALIKSAVQGLPVPNCSVEDRLRPLNPFYIEKEVKKKRFIPDITSPVTSAVSTKGVDVAVVERKAKADGKKAQKAAEKFSVALSANIKANVKIRKSTAQMPPSYNGFIANNLVDHQNYGSSPIELLM